MGRARHSRYDAVFVALYAGPLLAARAGMTVAGTAGGAETQVFLVARELARRGHRIAIAAIDTSPQLPPMVEGVHIVALPARPENGPRRQRIVWQLRFLAALLRLDAGILVQRSAGFVTGVVGLAARIHRRPFVYSSAHVMDFTNPFLRRPDYLLFRLGTRLARTLVVQAEEQAEAARTQWGRSSTVIRSFAEPAPRRQTVPDAFLWIGRLTPYKRPDAYIELAERVPEAQFRLIATESAMDPSALERLMDRARQLPNVEVLGPRTRAELAPLYDAAVAVVNTSEAEGMSNVFLEAWARGVPALVLSHDPDDLVAQRGLGWFADGSTERLAELARSAWAGRFDQAGLAARCREHIEREHGPEHVAARWERALGLSA